MLFRSPLHCAAYWGQVKAIEALLEAAGKDKAALLAAKNDNGKTALDIAAEGNTAAVKTLKAAESSLTKRAYVEDAVSILAIIGAIYAAWGRLLYGLPKSQILYTLSSIGVMAQHLKNAQKADITSVRNLGYDVCVFGMICADIPAWLYNKTIASYISEVYAPYMALLFNPIVLSHLFTMLTMPAVSYFMQPSSSIKAEIKADALIALQAIHDLERDLGSLAK